MNTPPSDLEQQLTDFRQQCPEQYWQSSKHRWRYYRLGELGKPCLLILPHGGTTAEVMFPYLMAFSTTYDVICPTIPPTLDTVSDTVSDLHAFLSALQIEKTDLIGMSFGGLLAQIFVRRYPTLIQHLILTHTTIPSAHLLELVNTQRSLIAVYPQWLLRWLMQRGQLGAIASSRTTTDTQAKAFWSTYYAEWYRQHFSKKAFLARSRITADYHRQGVFKSDDLKGWTGNLLLIESEFDEVISEGDQGAVKGMYPRAYVQTLTQADHLAPLLNPDALISSMLKFLQKGDS